jgi:hypothetical protein
VLRGETPEYVVNPEVLSRWRARWSERANATIAEFAPTKRFR